MKSITIISIVLSSCFVSNAQAVGLADLAGAAGTMQKGAQTLQAGQALAGAAGGSSVSGGLTDMLVQQLGVTPTQATGGAGAVFQLAKSKMQAAAFEKLSGSVPGMSGLLAAAPAMNPAAGGLNALAKNVPGMSGNSTSNLVGLAGSFQQLGLGPDMVQKFVPVVMQYVQGTGGGAVSSMLQSALMGGM